MAKTIFIVYILSAISQIIIFNVGIGAFLNITITTCDKHIQFYTKERMVK